MAFGITETGFNKKTLQDALTSLNERVTEAFGAVNTSPESVFGQYNGIISEIIGDLWELADQVYASQYSLSAVGASLDAVAELNNLTRLSATKSSALVVLNGTQATVIPAGTQFRQTNTDEIFETTGAVTLDNASVLKAVFSCNDPATAPHTLDIVTSAFGTDSYSSALTTSEIDVLNDLASQINTLGNHKAEVDSSALTLTITNLKPSDEATFDVSTFGATLDLDEQWTPTTIEDINTGTLEVPAGSIVTIETPVAGLADVENLTAGTEGRDLETDDEFRLRRKTSLNVVGSATVPAIAARLVQEVEEVTACVVKDNRTDTTDAQGRPPHSLEAIVTFSPDTSAIRQEIANKLWELKPAGIRTFGQITQTITDSAGDAQAIFFTQPIEKYIHINVNITLNAEENFPVGGEDSIAESLATFGNLLNAGDDVIRQRFFNSIYTAVPGVGDVALFELAATENPGDAPVAITADTVNTEPEAGLYNIFAGPLISLGVVSGMVVTESGGLVSSVSKVLSETQFRAKNDVFSPGDLLTFGGFGQVNIGMHASEVAKFDASRITVTVV